MPSMCAWLGASPWCTMFRDRLKGSAAPAPLSCAGTYSCPREAASCARRRCVMEVTLSSESRTVAKAMASPEGASEGERQSERARDRGKG